GYEAERPEHLHVLLVERLDLADGLLARLGQMDENPQAKVFAEVEVLAGARACTPVRVNRPLGHRGGAAADDALDAVADHEIQRARFGADDRLPALDGAMDRARYEGQLLQLVAAVRHAGRQRVVLAAVREPLVVERLEDDLDLLLEQLAVGLLIQDRRAERLDLARVIAATQAEDDPALRLDVGDGVVLRQPQRMPHGGDVEAAADLDALGDVGEVDGVEQEVGNDLVALVLEMVLREPDRVIARLVHAFRDGVGLVEDRRQALVGEAPLVGGRRVLAHVRQVHVAGVDGREFGDHLGGSISSGMIHSGLRPAATRWMLSKPLRKRPSQFSHVGPAECGVSVTLGSVNSGLSFAGGSSTSTSSPAPPILRSRSAW